MQILDRHISFMFTKIFLICFISFTGLYVIIDAFTNLEEFLQLSESGQLSDVLMAYYGPRVLQFFDRTAALMALVAAIFSLVLMQRSNELTAIQAGGIPNRRIAKPLIVVTVVVIILTIVNRELWIPQFRNQLTSNAQDLTGGKARSVKTSVDYETGIVIRGKQVLPVKKTVLSPEFTLPEPLTEFGSRLFATSAKYLEADDDHPSGFLLTDVNDAEENISELSQKYEGRTLLHRPADTHWLRPNELFVVTTINCQQLAFGNQPRFSTLNEMITNSRLPSASFSNQQRVEIHSRIVQPVFDMMFLLIGLPLVISRGERNLFFSVGLCVMVVILMLLVGIACQAMGAARVISPPALAAWIPLILFVPVSAVTYHLLSR